MQIIFRTPFFTEHLRWLLLVDVTSWLLQVIPTADENDILKRFLVGLQVYLREIVHSSKVFKKVFAICCDYNVKKNSSYTNSAIGFRICKWKKPTSWIEIQRLIPCGFNLHGNSRSSRPEVFCKEGVLRNFAKFTGKHLCQRPQANF